MAKIVGGFLLPHDPLVTANPDAPAKEQGDAVRGGFAHVARRLQELEVDTVIVVGDDHYTVFGPSCLPRYLIVVGEAAGPVEPWVGLPQQPFRINQPLAQHIMQYGFDNGADWAVAKSITLDHSTSLPIHLCFQDKPGISAIPVLINSGVEPLISNRRCHRLGEQMRAAVQAWEGNERVAILGTGGISHWVGMKDMGRVNVPWDKMIMAAVERGDAEAIIALSDDEIIRESGNGGLEIKNWLVALGFIDQFKGEVIEYQAVNEWVTGCGFMEIARMSQIDFYFDFWSPYAYLASGRLAEMAARQGCTIDYCPIDLTRAKLSAGNTGPPNLAIPPKIRYLMTDLKRWCARYGLPFGGVPKSKDTKRINIGTLLAQDRGMARNYVREAYDATWGQGGDPNSDEMLSALAVKLGWDADEFLGYIGSPAAEARYEAIFEEAVQRGVFGVPIMLVGDEMWWGNDRLDFLEEFLTAQA